MEKIKQYVKQNKFIIIISFFTIFILMLPNLHSDVVIGDDYIYHFARIQSMADSIKNGVYLIKINGTLANYFGYASRNVLP